jgi:hypothetical protein
MDNNYPRRQRDGVGDPTLYHLPGQALPLCLVQGAHLPSDWVLAVSNNGWTTNKLSLEWLKHFDKRTKQRVIRSHRLLIIDGHESHKSLNFQQYCKDNKIITICMPPHSSHLLQPLNVGCFSPLKTAYGRQAENLMRNKITHITKTEFLPCFIAAHNASITKSNIQGGFRGAGLVPHNPEAVLSKIDVKLRTPSPLPVEDLPWQSQTLRNTQEFRSQSTLLKDRLQRHVDSSPTSIVNAMEKFSKGAAIIAHSMVLLTKRNAELEAANEAATRRKSHKRKGIQREGVLVAEEGVRLTTIKEFAARGNGQKAKKRARVKAGEPSQRRCGRCSETGHNSRTCKQEAVVDSE